MGYDCHSPCQHHEESREAPSTSTPSSTRTTSDKSDSLESNLSMYNEEDSTAHRMQVRHGSPFLPASPGYSSTYDQTRTRQEQDHLRQEQLPDVRPQAGRKALSPRSYRLDKTYRLLYSTEDSKSNRMMSFPFLLFLWPVPQPHLASQTSAVEA